MASYKNVSFRHCNSIFFIHLGTWSNKRTEEIMKLNPELLLVLLGVELRCREFEPGIFDFYFLGDDSEGQRYDFNGLTDDEVITRLGKAKLSLIYHYKRRGLQEFCNCTDKDSSSSYSGKDEVWLCYDCHKIKVV